jgi:outer membrane protein assembly factor BamB
LYGHICLAPAGDFDYRPAVDNSRLERGPGDLESVAPFEIAAGDWPCYRRDNARTSVTETAAPKQAVQRWAFQPPSPGRSTAPVAAGGTVFVGHESGAVRALDADSGQVRWQVRTSGAVYYPPAVWNGRVYAGAADGRVYAFEAATGRRLWTFRAAPAERWIPVYGKLMSTWPVAGGVVVDNGVVYAAAGIAHYDGLYVYALDAVTGQVNWCNDTSGALSQVVDSGISLQGDLYIAEGELRFLGGGAYEIARYDLRSGQCLNSPHDEPASRFHTAFYPYFPEYARYLSLNCQLPDGKSLVYDASYEGSQHSRLVLMPTSPPNAAKPRKPESRWNAIRPIPKEDLQPVWQDDSGRIFSGFVVGPETLLAAGQSGPEDGRAPILAAINLQDGADVWLKQLPAVAVKGGVALDRAGRVFVSLENGQVLGFADN